MCIDTNTSKNWNPYRALAVMGVWLVMVVVIAFALASCSDGTPPAPSNGSISLAWSITDARGAPSTCAQVGGRSVVLRLRPRTGGDLVVTTLPCAISPGTAQVATGAYDVAIELHAADGTKLAAAPDQTNVSIRAGRVTTLTPVRFAATMKFRLVVSIATPASTNCRPTTSGGAGITGTTITLEGADPDPTRQGCAAVTFNRALGTTQRGMYTVDCSSPAVAACIEKTETLTTSIAPGIYRIHVRGKRATNECWQRDDTFTVAASNTPTRHAVGLLHINGPGC
jgi:hypothetical protein